MSRVGGRETKLEILVRKYLHLKGFRFRKNDKRYPGTPDLVLPKFNTIIFVHGCFWHGHKNCRLSRRPNTNKTYWNKKIDENIKRDNQNIKELRKIKWCIIIIWECQIKSASSREKYLAKLSKRIYECKLK